MGRPKGSKNAPKVEATSTEPKRKAGRPRAPRKAAMPAAETQRFYLFDSAPIAEFDTMEAALAKADELQATHPELAVAIGDVKLGRTRTMFVFDASPSEVHAPRRRHVEPEANGVVAQA